MTEPEVLARTHLLKDEYWLIAEMNKWFGVDLSDADSDLRIQFEKWASEWSPSTGPLDAEKTKIHRNLFELFLQKRGLVTTRFAAVRLGMSVSSFRLALQAFRSGNYITGAEFTGEFDDVFRSSLLDAFRKRLPELERMTFASYSGFVRMLHAELYERFHVKVEPLYDETSKALGEEPVEYADEFDCISDEPMGLPFKINLDTNKPIQLALDACSWITYARFENILAGERLGRIDEEFEEKRDVIKRVIRH